MIRIVCSSVVAYGLGLTFGAAEPALPLVAATGHPGVEIPAGTLLKVAATAVPPDGLVPIALAMDDQSRVLIVEQQTSKADGALGSQPMEWFLENLAAKTSADSLALLEKWKDQIPAAYRMGKFGRVRRLSDANSDGLFGQSSLIGEGYGASSVGTFCGNLGAVFAYQGAVYLAGLPALMLLQDENDKSDSKADLTKTLLDGFGVHLTAADHALRGLTLGPDGRLYGTMGDRGLHITTKDGKREIYPNQGCAFRVEADGSGFEVFHTGLRDPQGVAFDALGNAFTVEPASGLGEAARLIYLAEGGDSGWLMEYQTLHDFHRQIGLPEAPPNPWIDEHMGELKHDLRPAYILPPAAQLSANPLGLTIHPGTGLLEAEAGRLLICEQAGDAAHSGIISYQMKAAGAGMEVSDSRPLLRGIAATAAQYSWDGQLLLTAAGKHRLYALDAGSNTWRAAEAAATAKLVREGFDQRNSAELGTLLRHPDARIRLRAQLAISRLPDALPRFVAATASADLIERVHGVWGLGILARRGSGSPVVKNDGFGIIPDNKLRIAAGQQLAGLLKNPDPEIRAQAVRAIGDAENRFIRPPDVRQRDTLQPVDTYITADGLPLAAMLIDESPRVRYFAALSIGKLKVIGFYSPLCNFLKANNNQDPYLRHAGAYAFQHIAPNPGVLAGLERFPSPAVRLAATVALRRMHDPDVATFINDPDVQVADEAIRAVTDLSLDEVRVSLGFLLDNLAARPWTPLMLRRLIHNAFRLGGPANSTRLLKLPGDPSIPVEIQKESLRLLALWLEPPPVDPLTGCWRPLAKRDAAEIKPALSAELPRLLKSDGFVRSAALDLAKQYQISVPDQPK